jgi:hypothetical protein
MIVIYDTKDIDRIEVFSTLSGLCKLHKWAKYHTLREKKFPFTYKGWRFQKIEVNRRRV